MKWAEQGHWCSFSDLARLHLECCAQIVGPLRWWWSRNRVNEEFWRNWKVWFQEGYLRLWRYLILLLLLSGFSRVRLCVTPIDSSPPGSPVPGILQARTLEWVAISFSNAWKWKVKVKSLSHVRILATPWTAAYQAPPFMGFSRQEYWNGLPLPSPEVPHSYFQIFKTLVN